MSRYAGLLLSTCLLVSAPALGQVYPAQPIKLVIPFAQGGGADLGGRLIAERLTGILKQKVFVENRPGEGGTAATGFASRAAPDGYTLLYVTTSTFVTSPIFGKAPNYDPLSSFVPISLLSIMPAMIVVNPSLPARNLAELNALIKQAPGRYRYATGGTGTFAFLLGELYKSQTQLDIKEVQYKGSFAALKSVESGTADIMFDVIVFFPASVSEGKVRPIAVMAGGRSSRFPEVPSTVESGMPDLFGYSWTGLVAPYGTAAETVDVLNRAVRAALAEIETQTTLLKYGLVATGSTPSEFHDIIRAELTRWSRALPLSATSGK